MGYPRSQQRGPLVALLAMLHATMAFAATSLIDSDGACPVATMFPYTIGHGRWPAKANQELSFAWLSAAQMAMDHFNEKDTSVVPELARIQDCPVHFPPPTVLDSAMEGPAAVNALWTATTTIPSTNETSTPQTSTVSVRPCAVLGPMEPRAVEEVSAITTALDVPHLFYFSESTRFWQTGLDGNFVGMVLCPNARAHIMAQWLSGNGRDYLAVLHWGKDGSSDLADELKEIGPQYYDMVVQTFLRQGRRNVDRLIKQVYDSGISTILLNFDNPRSLSSMANAFADLDMLTAEYIFLISPDSLPTDYRLQEVYGDTMEIDSNLDKLLSRALVFDLLEPYRLNADDSFLESWRGLDANFVHRINEANPLSPDNEAYYEAPVDFFSTALPTNYATFVYDAIMLLGFGACQAYHDAQIQQATDKSTGDILIDREELIASMFNQTFHGASGLVSPFPEDESYRNSATDIQVGLYQVVATTKIETESGNATRVYESVLTNIWKKEKWNQVPGVEIQFANGQAPPSLVPELVEHNYLSKEIRIVGLTILAFTWAIAAGALVAIIMLRTTSETVQRAQPFFLILLCVGSIVTSTAILGLSWDESYGSTDSQLDAACMASQWTFFLGHVTTYMALFSKLWRVDRVLQFRRNNAVSVRQVLGPLAALLALTLILLVLWTSLDPWRWERTWVTRMPPETFGECTSDHFWAFFGPLMGIVLAAEALTTFFAFRTSDVPEEFGDSRTALFAIYTHVQSWVFGIPVLAVLGTSSADATYIARVLLIWIFSISSVLVVVGPKIHGALFVEPYKERCSRVRVSGIGGNSQESDPSSRRASITASLKRKKQRNASSSFEKKSPGKGGKMGSTPSSSQRYDSTSQASNPLSSLEEPKPSIASMDRPENAVVEETHEFYE